MTIIMALIITAIAALIGLNNFMSACIKRQRDQIKRLQIEVEALRVSCKQAWEAGDKAYEAAQRLIERGRD